MRYRLAGVLRLTNGTTLSGGGSDRSARRSRMGSRPGGEVVEVAHDVLVGADEQHAEIVRLAGLVRMQLEGLLDVLQVDELVDLTVAVAGDVHERSAPGRPLEQAVDRHDGEKLVERPVVGNALEN